MASVYASSVIQAPADKVWQMVRDFNALPQWHPAIVESRIEGDAPSDQVGCIRAFRLQDGGFIREKLLSLSDYDFSFSYSILESPMAVTQYVASMRLYPITENGQCFAEWQAEFECAPRDEADLVFLIGQNVFQGGLTALNARLGGG